MKILVFGGSFDPPHKGHLALLLAAARAVEPDRILIVPAWRSPLKARLPAPAADRLALTRVALLEALPSRWRARAKILDAELKARKPVYTVQTLETLAHEHRGAELHFVTGWDSAASFNSWRKPARLAELARWWTVKRPGSKGRVPGFFRLLKARMPEISSSETRARLSVGDDASEFLMPKALALIERRKLYGLDRMAQLQGMLSPHRYEHSRAVARLAGALARRWDVDEPSAILAGLLHDSGRSVAITKMGSYAESRRLGAPHRAQAGKRQPLSLHAYVSADVARRAFGVVDPAVLSAVRKHTLGDPRMSRFDKLLYVADSCSADRKFPEAAALRRLAFGDLDEAYKACARNKLRWCLETDRWIHPLAVTAWNALV